MADRLYQVIWTTWNASAVLRKRLYDIWSINIKFTMLHLINHEIKLRNSGQNAPRHYVPRTKGHTFGQHIGHRIYLFSWSFLTNFILIQLKFNEWLYINMFILFDVTLLLFKGQPRWSLFHMGQNTACLLRHILFRFLLYF